MNISTFIRVAFQGSRGAYSEQALHSMLDNAEAIPCMTFEDVFSALKNKQADMACIPIENSIAGRVADIHYLLPKYDVRIVAEHYQPIHHQLLGVQGATLKDIQEVHSHIHALGQCREIIKKHKLRVVVHTDTAGAAHDIATLKDPTKAAVASRLASKLYDLKILLEDIEDTEHNITRFLLITLANSSVLTKYPMPALGEWVITSLFFNVRSVPAALYKAIGGFATNGINLTKIESYITGPDFSVAQFYIDVEGHPESKEMKHALDELFYFSSEVRLLGTYYASEFRKSGREVKKN